MGKIKTKLENFTITETDKAWIAGVVDLKGRMTNKISTSRRFPQICLYVQFGNMIVINKLNRLTGTNAELNAPKPIRDFIRKVCTEHCPESHSHVVEYDRSELTMPPNARWLISGAGLAVVLDNIMPYLSDTKDYQEVIDFLYENIGIIGQGSSMSKVSLRRLCLLGWKLPEHYMSVMD